MSIYRIWYNKKRNELIKIFGGECERCQRKTNLEIDHKRPNLFKGPGRGSYNRLKDVQRNIFCYLLLCKE